jgi:hypothetical protein
MTDISVTDLERRGDKAIVTVISNGSDAHDVKVSIYLDGSFRFSQRVALQAGKSVEMDMPIGSVKEGKHEITATVTTNYEYSGLNGIYLENNSLTINVEIEGDDDDNSLRLFALALIVVAVLLLIVTLVLRRRD